MSSTVLLSDARPEAPALVPDPAISPECVSNVPQSDPPIASLRGALLPDGGLQAPFERWPTRAQREAFPGHREAAAALLAGRSWPAALRALVASFPIRAASPNFIDDLRSTSAFIAMLAHLTPQKAARGELELVNDRRRRTPYSSYPTPPQVARAIAQYIRAHLVPAGQPLTILDPTMEGAPLLLECANAFRDRADVRLVGIDRSPAVIAAATALFDHATAGGLPRPALLEGDAFEMLLTLDPIDALVNNPPWGERGRNGAEHFPGSADPYTHFVIAALARLKPAGPFGLVLPGQALTAVRASDLRRHIRATCDLDVVAVLPKHCFPRATVRTVVLLGRKRCPQPGRRFLTLIAHPAGALGHTSAAPVVRTLDIGALDSGGGPWIACATEPSFRSHAASTIPLESIAVVGAGIVPYRIGRGRPAQTLQTLAERPFTYAESVTCGVPVLRGRQVRQLHCAEPREWIALGPHLAFAGEHDRTRHEQRLYLRELCGRDGRMVAAPAPDGSVPRYGVICITPSRPIRLLTFCAILGSGYAAQYVSATCDGIFRESFNRVRVGDIRRFPLPVALIEDDRWSARVEALCQALLASNTLLQSARLGEEIEALIEQAYGAESEHS